LQLANRARAEHDYVDAEGYYGRALDQKGHGEPDEALFAALHGRGLMRYRLARYDDALQDLHRARARAIERGDRIAQIANCLDEATVLDWLDDWHGSREVVAQAEQLAGEMAEPPGALLAARLAMARARSAHRFSDDSTAAELFLEAAKGAESMG